VELISTALQNSNGCGAHAHNARFDVASMQAEEASDQVILVTEQAQDSDAAALEEQLHSKEHNCRAVTAKLQELQVNMLLSLQRREGVQLRLRIVCSLMLHSILCSINIDDWSSVATATMDQTHICHIVSVIVAAYLHGVSLVAHAAKPMQLAHEAVIWVV